MNLYKVKIGKATRVAVAGLKKASIRGEMAHKCLQNYFLGIQKPYDIRYFKALNKFIKAHI